MTKKHFKKLAEMLRRTTPNINYDVDGRAYIQWQRDCQAVAEACREFNYQFNYIKFIDACEGR